MSRKHLEADVTRLLGRGELFAPSPETLPGLASESFDPADIIAEEDAIRALRRGSHKIKLASSFTVDCGSELTGEDYRKEASAREGTPSRTHIPRLSKIRTIHHQLAIMLAGGTKDIDAARTLGMTAQRIYQLKLDPAFQELLESYKSASIKDTLDAQMRCLGLGTLAMEQLMDQLLEDSGELAPALLLKISTEMLDRAGYSPAAQAKGKGSGGLPSEDQIRALKQVEREKQEGTVILRSTQGGQGDESGA